MKELNLVEILIAAAFALLGGSVHILGKLSANRYNNKWGIAYDAAAAFFAGALAYVLCRYLNLESWAVGGLTGLAGHGGARAIAAAEQWAAKRAGVEIEKQ